MKFLLRLSQQLDQVDGVDLHKAESALQAANTGDYREEILGELPEDLRKLWVVIQKTEEYLKKQAQEHEEEHRTAEMTGKKPECAKIHCNFERGAVRLKALSTLFWEAVRDEFPRSQEKSAVALRKGWQATMYNEGGSGFSLLSIFGSGSDPGD